MSYEGDAKPICPRCTSLADVERTHARGTLGDWWCGNPSCNLRFHGTALELAAERRHREATEARNAEHAARVARGMS